jgi:mRNA-degrading endonuclease RelE of RelBE toxin-antitoxin system
MVVYKVLFKASVEKDFAAIPKKDLRKIIKGIEGLVENPRPSGCEKLTGKKDIGSAKDGIASFIQSKTMTSQSGW